MRRASEPAGTLRAVIERALPRRALPVERALLVKAIAERIEAYRSTVPDVQRYRERLKAATKITDSLRHALEKAGGRLKRLGVDEDMKRKREQAAALGIVSAHPPLRGYSPALDLYLIAWRAVDSLRGWNKMYRPREGAPPAVAATLTERIRELCELSGCTAQERNRLLDQLSGRHGLPKLSVETLKKRKTRSKKK
jgi:hypothetical protein